MGKDNIFESARKLNEWLKKENKKVLIRKGQIVGFIGNEDLYYAKKKAIVLKRRKK
jgi:hypothetical protein